MDRIDNALKSGFAQAMDVPGMNYRVHKYQMAYDRLPQGFLLGSETASTVSSRGVYQFPVVPEAVDAAGSSLRRQHYNGQCSSYDVQWCSWSNLPDDDWRWQDDKDWVIGEFVWTGYDYLGEPTPYDEFWPSRSSYFGICDLAGLPKDRYYLYRSKWNKEEHTIHLLPHWSWGTAASKGGRKAARKDPQNRIGLVTPVYCYTDYPEAELFVNGKSQGRIRKNAAERLDRYRLRWNDVTYEPGELRVVVYDENGKNCGEQSLRTAGEPARLLLDCWTQNDRGSLKADGEDLAFITVSLADEAGTLVPSAQDQLAFEVEGAGTFRAVCNGDATSLESFKQPRMKLFNGELVVILRPTTKAGKATLTVKDQRGKLKPVMINIVTK
jgi:beta-galactosidase